MAMPNAAKTALLALLLLLGACGGKVAGREPIGKPPPSETRTATLEALWQASVGAMSPLLQPALTNNASRVCTVSRTGAASFINMADGANDAEPVNFSHSDDYTAGAGCDGDIIAAVSGDGWLRVYHAVDGLLWEKNLKTRVFGAPLLVKGKLFVLGLDGRLLAYTQKQGRELWRYVSPREKQLRTPLESSPLLVDNIIYSGVDNGAIVAVEQSNGRVLWENVVSVPGGNNAIANILDVTTPVVSGSTVCAAAYQGAVACFNRRDGERLWDFPLSAQTRAAFDAAGAKLFISDTEGVLYAFDVASGEVLWRNETGQQLSAPLVADNMVLAGDGFGALHAFFVDNGNLGASLALNAGRIIHLQPAGWQPAEFIALSQDGLLSRLRLVR